MPGSDMPERNARLFDSATGMQGYLGQNRQGTNPPYRNCELTAQYNLSIGVLSDRQDDVALIDSTLRDAGHAAHCYWVNSPEALNETLTRHEIELLILNCDSYQDSTEAVIEQKDCFNPEVPVLALAHDADEQAIQQAMEHAPAIWSPRRASDACRQSSQGSFAPCGSNAR